MKIIEEAKNVAEKGCVQELEQRIAEVEKAVDKKPSVIKEVCEKSCTLEVLAAMMKEKVRRIGG